MARVLVVDDDPMLCCMAIEVYLERNNFQVAIADGDEAGLRALENDAFDLMIVDIFVPHMRGFESIRIFHERPRTSR
jgi:DNA-binding response OmpR family regulator